MLTYWLTYWIIMGTIISTVATYIVLQRKGEWERLCLLIAAPALALTALDWGDRVIDKSDIVSLLYLRHQVQAEGSLRGSDVPGYAAEVAFLALMVGMVAWCSVLSFVQLWRRLLEPTQGHKRSDRNVPIDG